MLFTVRGDGALLQVTKRGHGVSVLGVQKLSGNGPAQHTVALLEQRGWTKLPLRVPSNLNNSVIFINTEFMKSLQLSGGLNPVCLCSCNGYWGEFGFSDLGNHPSPVHVYSVDWNVYWDHAKGELLKWVYLSCSASHILLAHCMLH